MIYLLIDNCSLRDLIDIHGYSKYIDILDNHISSKKIFFVTHQLILDEWNKHKEPWKDKKIKKLLGYNQIQAGNDGYNRLLPATNFIQTNHIEVQIKKINALLQSAYIIETPPVIKNEFSERYRNRLAPFHNKLQSQNDWDIFGSFCHYCEINGIQQLHFMSKNTNEFAHLDDITIIHDDFTQRFTKTHINYYNDFQQFFEGVSDLNHLPVDLLSFRMTPNPKYSHKSTIRKNVLDSICYLFKELHNELDFIPLHLIVKYYPFASSELSHTYFSHFTIYEASDDIMTLFENISISKDKIHIKDEKVFTGISDYKSKIEYVIQKLTNNLIFHLEGEKRTKRVCSHIERNEICNCVRCLYERFEFFSCFNLNRDIGNSYKEKLKNAYVNYKLGNYNSANAIYDNICSTALKDKCYISYFLAKYNQRHLSRFLSNFITNKTINQELINRLKEIDPIEEAWKLKGLTDYNLLIFICQEDYFSDAFQNITITVNKIIATYYAQLNGGWSSNYHISDLLEEFTKVDALLQMNCIIYDQYSNFENLFEKVTEGLFASHAISEENGSRFVEFNDYWIQRFVHYGNREKIILYFKKYNLEHLKYVSDGKMKDTFFELFQNLTANKKLLQNSFESLADEGNYYFDTYFEKLVENSIIMLSILDLPKYKLEKFAIILFIYLESQKGIKYSLCEVLSFFFQRNKDGLFIKTKLKFLKLFIKSEHGCNTSLVEDIIASFKQNEGLKISKADFETLINQSLSICKKCNSAHDLRVLSLLFDKGNASMKAEISSRIKSKLGIEWSFSLFYSSAMYEIIDLNPKKLFELIDNLQLNKKEGSFKEVFSGMHDFQKPYLDQIINLCFKYKINTNTSRFKKLSAVHPCYKWLLNMEEFNYENFNPKWVIRYRLKYFYRAMSKSEKLKNALRNYLSSKNHSGIERVLLTITNFIP